MPKDSPEMREYKLRQTLKRQLWVATVAVDAFKNVRTTAHHYLKARYNEHHPLHYTFVSSIVVTYCKVFTSTRSGAELPKYFTCFDEQDLQITHDALMLVRNNIYAHSDATFQNYKLSMHVERVEHETRLELRANAPHLNDIGIPYAIQLCNVQLDRLKAYRREIVPKLLPLRDVEATLDTAQRNSIIIPIEWPKPLDPNLTEPPNAW